MVVQGTLLVNGTENEKVRLIRKKQDGAFRLFGGSSGEGRLEFFVNGTWMPMCFTRRFFNIEAHLICRQLNLVYRG